VAPVPAAATGLLSVDVSDLPEHRMSARSWAPAQGARPRPYARIAFASGKRYERQGDLEGAARWFRRAAEADLSDAALRLGDVLGRLAVQRGTAGDGGADGPRPGSRSTDRLMAEATRWLSEAQTARHPDAIELITDMLNRQQRLAALRAGEQPAAPPPERPAGHPAAR
jgi:TPR repeat protein